MVQVNNAESSKPLKNVNAFMEWNPPPPYKKEKGNVDGSGVIEMRLLWKSQFPPRKLSGLWYTWVLTFLPHENQSLDNIYTRIIFKMLPKRLTVFIHKDNNEAYSPWNKQPLKAGNSESITYWYFFVWVLDRNVMHLSII